MFRQEYMQKYSLPLDFTIHIWFVMAESNTTEGVSKLIKSHRQDIYLKDFEESNASKIPEQIRNCRENLPIFDKKQIILEKIRSNQVVLIKGETGTYISNYVIVI